MNTGNGLTESTIECDLAVIGSGAAGLTAALAAASKGARVVVLEKDDLIGGTTAVSGGGVWIPNNKHVGEVGAPDSRDEALGYMRAVGRGEADEEILETLLDAGPEMVEFLESECGFSFEGYPSTGPTLDYRPDLPGARHGGRTLDAGWFRLDDLGELAEKLRLSETARTFTIRKRDYYVKRLYLYRTSPMTETYERSEEGYIGGGAALVAQLLSEATQRGVVVETSIAARSLVQSDTGVSGVQCERDGQIIDVVAAHGVVLATGGYEWDEELKRAFMRRPLTHPASPPIATGDGLRMGQAVGAGLGNMGDAWWTPTIETNVERWGATLSVMSRSERCMPFSLMVNRLGRRFVNEATNYYDVCEPFGATDPRTGELVNLPAWLIFDQNYRDRYSVHGLAEGETLDELPPWITGAPDLRGLAKELEIDADALEETVRRFNGFAERGVDEDFGRGESVWDLEWGDPAQGPNPSLGPVETGPFYAMQLHSGALGTKGGLLVDGGGRVRDAFGDVIAGLFAAGNVAHCSVPGGYTGPGATIGPAMTFGYVIGSTAGALSGEGNV